MHERLAMAFVAVAVLAMTWNACARHVPAWSVPDTSLAGVQMTTSVRAPPEPLLRTCPTGQRSVLEAR